MEISEQPTLAGFEDESQFLAQVFHASRPPLPGSGEARRMTVGSGRQLSMLLDQSSPLGAFSRILLESSLWTSSEEFSYVWNRLDTRFACSAFQLTPLGRDIEDSGSSLWQTPVADDAIARVNGKINSRGEPKLSAQAKLWPTPTVPNGGRRNPDGTSITGKKPDGGKAQIDLREFAIRLLPTPQAHDAANGNPARVNRFGTEHGGRNLNDEMADSTFGSLNPRFVEELMGFPIDHTALKPSAMR